MQKLMNFIFSLKVSLKAFKIPIGEVWVIKLRSIHAVRPK